MTVMGGLTVLEAILLAIWITLNVVMLWNWYYYYTEPYDYGEFMPFPCVRMPVHLQHLKLYNCAQSGQMAAHAEISLAC